LQGNGNIRWKREKKEAKILWKGSKKKLEGGGKKEEREVTYLEKGPHIERHIGFYGKKKKTSLDFTNGENYKRPSLEKNARQNT